MVLKSTLTPNFREIFFLRFSDVRFYNKRSKSPVLISKKDNPFEKSEKSKPFFIFEIIYFLSWKGYAICKLHKTIYKSISEHFQFSNRVVK